MVRDVILISVPFPYPCPYPCHASYPSHDSYTCHGPYPCHGSCPCPCPCPGPCPYPCPGHVHVPATRPRPPRSSGLLRYSSNTLLLFYSCCYTRPHRANILYITDLTPLIYFYYHHNFPYGHVTNNLFCIHMGGR